MTETEGASFGMGMINLKPWNEREQTAEELMRVYADRVSHIKDADIQFFLPPTVPGFGNASGFELRLQDKTAGTFAELDEVAKSFVAKLMPIPVCRVSHPVSIRTSRNICCGSIWPKRQN